MDTIYLSLSEEERELYSKILEDSKRTADAAISRKSNIKKYNGLLTAILRLRMLCDQGTFYRVSASTLSSEESDRSKLLNALQMGNGVTCELCDSNDELPDLMRDISSCPCCSRMLCPICFDLHSVNEPQEGGRESLQSSLNLLARTSNRLSVNENQPPRISLTKEEILSGNCYSTKLAAVLKNIEENMHGTKR